MTSIRSFSEILQDRRLGAEDRARYAGIIHAESLRLTRLLDDLLDLAVLENGHVRLDVTEMRLGAMLDRAVTAAFDGQGKMMLLHRDPAAESLILRTDSDRLTQVFINLITNAQKYCHAEPPELRIVVQRLGQMIAIDFIDNGPGIPKHQLALLFEKFARLEDMSKAGGAGLGLAICREIMVRLGGSIDYLPGQGGAAFRVTLPLTEKGN